MAVDRKKVFDELRKSWGGLKQGQVDGINGILDACERHSVKNVHHVANILANVARETGKRMEPVRETFADSTSQAISRLDRAWRKGQLTWVKSPYWRDGGFGRGQIQVSHVNYAKMGKRLGVDLVNNPDLALDMKVSGDIAVVGMSEGLFTGKKLSDYKFPEDLDNKPRENPRRIVNGVDGSDSEVKGYHMDFYNALSVSQVEEKKEPIWLIILKFILRLFKK